MTFIGSKLMLLIEALNYGMGYMFMFLLLIVVMERRD